MTAPGRRGNEPPSQGVLRGAVLIAAAVIIGALLLAKGFDGGAASDGGDDGAAATTTAGAGESSTSSTQAQPHPVNEVKVLVLNGGGPQGIAGTDTTALNSKGYVTVDPANAPADVAASVVYFTAGYDADAPAVAAALGLPASAVQPFPNPPPLDPQGANVVVILGPDAAPAG